LIRRRKYGSTGLICGRRSVIDAPIADAASDPEVESTSEAD